MKKVRWWPLVVVPVAVACSLVESADDIVVGGGDAGGFDAPLVDASVDAPPAEAGAPDASTDPRWAGWRMPSNTPTSYGEQVPGIVTDRVTGLSWQKTGASSATFAQASAACAALDAKGGKAFRLPARIELVSLLTFGRGIIPAINQSAFPGTPASPHWTSSALESGGRYVVDFQSGAVSTAVGTELFAYRCVR